MTIASFRVTRLLCLFSFVTADVGLSQTLIPPPSQARRTIAAEPLRPEESITLDGNLDEAVWQRAQVATEFVQIDPDNGTPATEQTEFRIAFDRNTLYLGVICHDSEAGERLIWA